MTIVKPPLLGIAVWVKSLVAFERHLLLNLETSESQSMWLTFITNILGVLCLSTRDATRIEAALVIQRAYRRARPRWRARRESDRLFYLTAETAGSVIGFRAMW
jgi:hypothetical protein